MKRFAIASFALLMGFAPLFAALAHDPQPMKGMEKPESMSATSTTPAQPAGVQADRSRPDDKAATVAIFPTELAVGRAQQLTIDVRDSKDRPVERFAVQHEKLMHLIVVSEDLKYFAHLHPEYVGKGRFRAIATFPTASKYTAFADYVPQGGSKQVGVQPLQAGRGDSARAVPEPDTSLSKTFGDLNVTLLLDPKTIVPGRETPVAFEFKNAQGKPTTDLQPYLGAMGHLVIIKRSPVLTAADYLHAHPEEHAHSKDTMSVGKMSGMQHDGDMPGMAGMNHGPDGATGTPGAIPGRVTFETAFPGPGTYRLWGQFKQNGKVITADYTITI